MRKNEKNNKEVLGTDIRKLLKIGSSLAITLPKEYVEAHGLKVGDTVQVYFDDVVHVEPVKPERILKKVKKEG